MKVTLQKQYGDINVLINDKVFAYLLMRDDSSFQITWAYPMDLDDQIQALSNLKIAISSVLPVMKKKDVIVNIEDGKLI